MDTGLSAQGAAKQVGAFIKDRRRSLGLSRAQLARRLGFVLGSYVSHIERGDARIAPGQVNDWARALELEPQAFRQQLVNLSGHGEGVYAMADSLATAN